jgi:hypothetical protein
MTFLAHRAISGTRCFPRTTAVLAFLAVSGAARVVGLGS